MSNRQNQSGVTLVVAIVMLASVTFISFLLSSIILREIFGARLIIRTEPAISGANAGGEIGLYQLLRTTGSITSGGSLQQSGTNYQVTADFYDDPYPFAVTSGNKGQITLYDPADPSNSAANYGSVTIINNSSPTSNPFKVEIYSFADLTVKICGTPVTVGVSQSFSCNTLNSSDDRYLLVISPTGNNNVSGQVTTTDNNGIPKGVPSNNPELEVTGINGNVQRKIRIKF